MTFIALAEMMEPATVVGKSEAREIAMPKLELFGTASCPYTQEMRDWLEFRRCEFVEYDVEKDSTAGERWRALAGGQRTVPVLVEDGKVAQVGWQGRGCTVNWDEM
jgi:glutaredoxin